MTLTQMSRVRRWQLAHRDRSPLESRCWDLVLTVWLSGWLGLPTALIVFEPLALAACALACAAPQSYLLWRTWLHRRGTLRCDWLQAALPARRRRQT